MNRLATALLAASVTAVAASAAFAALPTGTVAPDFSLKGGLAGKEIDFSLAQALKKGPVVLYFFPAAFTSGCTKEAHDFAEATPDFAKLHATVVGITAGNTDRVVEFSKVECRDKFAVVADPGAKVAKEYGATIPVVTAAKGYSSRTSFVIAQNGKIATVYDSMNPDEHVAKTMAAVKALEAK